MHRLRFVVYSSLFVGSLLASACSPAIRPTPPAPASAPAGTAPPELQVLRLATTTSTADSGLLDAILPDFEAKHNARVDVIAVGTGQALEIGAKGDADVVLVHARAREDQFVRDGDGVDRIDVMYNDFILVGPKDDPAGTARLATAQEAFARIAAAGANFASRGDDSGTHAKEQAIWASAAITPTAESSWYFSLGQGMGETLNFANEKPAYTLTDRGTWLSQAADLPNLAVMVGGADISRNQDKSLFNPYGVIRVNPAKHPGVNAELAAQFVSWLTSLETQQRIAEYGRDRFGQPLFYPSSPEWKRANP